MNNEKKFKKKKKRERAVRKKILAKRTISREADKEERKRFLLEKATKTKREPIRKLSPELQKTLDLVKKLEMDEKAKATAESMVPPVRGEAVNTVIVDDAAEPGK